MYNMYVTHIYIYIHVWCCNVATVQVSQHGWIWLNTWIRTIGSSAKNNVVLCITPDTLRVAARLDDRAQMRPQYARDSGKMMQKVSWGFMGLGKHCSQTIKEYFTMFSSWCSSIAATTAQYRLAASQAAQLQMHVCLPGCAILLCSQKISEVLDFEHKQTP